MGKLLDLGLVSRELALSGLIGASLEVGCFCVKVEDGAGSGGMVAIFE